MLQLSIPPEAQKVSRFMPFVVFWIFLKVNMVVVSACKIHYSTRQYQHLAIGSQYFMQNPSCPGGPPITKTNIDQGCEPGSTKLQPSCSQPISICQWWNKYQSNPLLIMFFSNHELLEFFVKEYFFIIYPSKYDRKTFFLSICVQFVLVCTWFLSNFKKLLNTTKSNNRRTRDKNDVRDVVVLVVTGCKAKLEYRWSLVLYTPVKIQWK